MEKTESLNDFCLDIQQQVISEVDVEGEQYFREDKFTEIMLDYLSEAGEIDDGMVCTYRSRGMQVNGYSISEDGESCDIYITNYLCKSEPIPVSATDVATSFKRGLTFVEKSFARLYTSLEEASPAFDLAEQLFTLKDGLTKVRLVYLTDGLVKKAGLQDTELNGIVISHHIWDMERLYKCWTSGKKRETIEIDFIERYGKAIPCLKMPESNPEYITYLAIFPATILVDLYGEYGTRLLERNVRSFLQARGQVNAGIRQTILNEPHMFLAYNNGLSGTSEAVEVIESVEGGAMISKLRDFQIVNGAQTTASLFHATKKDKADVSKVFVQVKLTAMSDIEKMDAFVPLISQYANSQNKVQTADFSANDPYHRTIEELSRTTWAPSHSGVQRLTRWYYERARGQYVDDREREGTPARKRAFEQSNPKHQKFTKTDLAKFELTWNQQPHIVSRGAQKNFREFTVGLKDRGKSLPSSTYFEHLIAKAILFKSTEKLVQQLHLGGYRAQIVTYTLALLSHKTAQRIDLDKIWKEQELSETLSSVIGKLALRVHQHIINAPGSANITEWCKKEECWNQLKSFETPEITVLESELVPVGYRTDTIIKGDKEWVPSGEEIKNVEAVSMYTPEDWYRLSSWAKETGNLESWQRSLAYSIGKLNSRNIKLSRKQTEHGVKIMEEAIRLGFIARVKE